MDNRPTVSPETITGVRDVLEEAVTMLMSLESMRPNIEVHADAGEHISYSMVYGFVAMRLGKSLDEAGRSLGGGGSGWFDSLRNPPLLGRRQRQVQEGASDA